MGGDNLADQVPTVDYSKFDPKFTNKVEQVAPEWGEFHQRRNEWIEQNRGKYVPKPLVPDNILGLIPLKTRLPATRNWYRGTSSYERNGLFNIHTPVFNTKWLKWSFPIFLIWGWCSFQIQGINYEYYNDNGERRNSMYWKQQIIDLPIIRLWNRPG